MSRNTVSVEDDTGQKSGENSRPYGGTSSNAFNMRVLNDAIMAHCHHGDGWRDGHGRQASNAALMAMKGLEPDGALEGLFAAQIVMAHAAAAECYRRAALPDQTFEGRQMNLSQAAKAARTFGAMAEGLRKARGPNSRQTVHVHHHHHDNRTQVSAGTAHLHAAHSQQEGEDLIGEGTQPHARHAALAHEPGCPAPAADLGTSMRCKDETREALPVASNPGEEEVPDARREESRRTEG